jgi:threonine/homoserine/homoserine lactone efflux protein
MDYHSFITLFIASLILMIKPGPYMMTFISMSLEGRWKAMLSFWSGYVIVRTAAYYALLMTLSMLPTGFGMVFIFIKATAAVIFITLGINGLGESIRQYEEASEAQQKELKEKNLVQTFFAGSLLCLSNPYDLVFILVVIPALMSVTAFTFWDITYIHLTVTLADVIVQLSYILPLMFIRNFISRDMLKKVKTGTSIALIGIGIYIFATILIRSDLVQSGLLSAM